jgi:hypothetical protein
MNLFYLLLAVVALAAMFKIFAQGFRSPLLPMANIGEGVHAGTITKKADAAIATRYLVVKIGSDIDHVAVAGTADIALGIASDEPAAAEDLVAVQLLGSSGETRKVVASAAITAGDFVVTAASGKVRTLPAITGIYYIIGRALIAAAADGDLVEIDPCLPTQRVVA